MKLFDPDIGLPRLINPEDPSKAPFQQHFALCELLADIICDYRPTTDQDTTGWEEEFPTFEETASKTNLPHSPEFGKYNTT